MPTYVVPLRGYQPSARTDGQPWTTAQIDEAPTAAGPWTTLETVALSPLDLDPAAPAVRNFTTELATLPAAWYQVTFFDEQGEEQPTEPVFSGPGFRPPVSEIAALMLDRTTIAGGDEAGTFNASTSPTADQVEQLISLVVDAIEPRIPADASLEVMRSARSAAALNAAILVETSGFGGQVDVNDTRVGVWTALLERHDAVIDAAARDDMPGGVRAYSIPIGTVVAASSPFSTDLLP